jgi:hypothetical protein
MTPITGSCHCGLVRWQFVLPVKTVVKCHCNNCRKLQGSDYSSWIVVPKSQFKFTSGAEDMALYRFTQVSEKHFCPNCGTTVYGINGKHFPEDVMIPLGEVDNYAQDLAPKIQVYTNDKAQWVQLHDEEPIIS